MEPPHDVSSSPESQPSQGVSDPPTTLKASLVNLGPGIIVAAAIVGSGELIATTKVGAEAGFTLLWLIIIGCGIKVFTQIELGRHAIATGQTALASLNQMPGPKFRLNWVLWYWMVMTVLIVAQQGGILGGIGQALTIATPLTAEGRAFNELHDERINLKLRIAGLNPNQDDAPLPEPTQSEADELQTQLAQLEADIEQRGEPNDPYIWAAIIAAVTSLLLYIGKYRAIQLCATIFVVLFTLVTIVAMILLQLEPQWAVKASEVAQGLSFQLPAKQTADQQPLATALAAFGIIGVGAAELLFYPYWCLEEGYARSTGPYEDSPAWRTRARGWRRIMQLDVTISMLIYTFATAAFYLLGAAVLWRSQLVPEGEDMIRTLSEMYVPVFGAGAAGMFLIGAIAVLYSTFFVAANGNAHLIADALGLAQLFPKEEDRRLRRVRHIACVWPWVALLFYVGIQTPDQMVLASGAAQAIMLPILGAAAIWFRSSRRETGLPSSPLFGAALWVSLAGYLIAAGGWVWLKLFQ